MRLRLPACLTLLLLLFLPAGLAAQARFTLGVDLGYTISDFSGPDAAGVRHRTGATAGAYLRTPLGRYLAVQSGLFIASKGGATLVTPAGGGAPVRFDLELVYVELPLLLRARVPFVAGTRLVLTGGAVSGVQIGCNVEFTQNGVSLLREACARLSGTTFQDWDLAWTAGGGIAVPIERSELALEVRLSQGLRRVSEQSDFRNRALTFLVSVPF